MFEKYEKLMVWQESHLLVKEIYQLTKGFPKEELFALTSQVRRAAVSAPSNIVEGRARDSAKEYARFLKIARGSLDEVSYQIYLAYELEYINKAEYTKIGESINVCGRLLNGLIKSIKVV